jgi:hypothetical protein
MTGNYAGPLFTVMRADGVYFSIGSVAQTGMVDLRTLHKDCDGYDCWLSTLYDQIGPNNMTAAAVLSGVTPVVVADHMPLMGYKGNGLPEIITTGNNSDGSGSGGPYNGEWVANVAPVGMPTTGSRTTYAVLDNGVANGIVTPLSIADRLPNSALPGGNWYMDNWRANANDPTSWVAGGDADANAFNIGAYPAGFAQFVDYYKYNQPALTTQAGVLLSTCMPALVTTCPSYATWLGPVGLVSSGTINTGAGHPVVVAVGQGSDNSTYGGHSQTFILANFFTSPSEDQAVLTQLAQTHFPKQPSGCGASRTILVPTQVGSYNNNQIQSYVGPASLNLSNLYVLWASELMNPDYAGPLFRITRQDTGASEDIYPAGCSVDTAALTAFCLGTTCNVPVVFDQSGHDHQMRATIPGNPPALNITGMKSGAVPCFQFTAQPLASFTASINAANGQMTVSAVSSGTITVPAAFYTTGVSFPQVIYSQISGTTGGTGVYATSYYLPSYSNRTNVAVFSNSSTALRTDNYLMKNTNGMPGLGLYQNQTVELVAEEASTGTVRASFLNMQGSAWSIGQGGSNEVYLFDLSGTNYMHTPALSFNRAHFIYWQSNAASPQALVMGMDNTTPASATSSTTNLGNSVYGYSMGEGSYAPGITGCIASATVYNDVENAANLLAHYAYARNVFGTP